MFNGESVFHRLFSPGKHLDGMMLTTLIFRSQMRLTSDINLTLLVEKANGVSLFAEAEPANSC